MSYVENIENRVREFRERAGISQTELGERLGVHWQTVHRIESDKSKLDLDKLRRIAAALAVDPLDLISKRTKAAMHLIPVIGIACLGLWRPQWRYLPDEHVPPPLAFMLKPGEDPADHAAVELRDPVDEDEDQARTIAIFRELRAGEPLLPGRRYLIERRHPETGLVEASMRTAYADTDDSLWLVPDSVAGGNGKAPVAYRDGVSIIGRVAYRIVREE